jgi:hypothetical protein
VVQTVVISLTLLVFIFQFRSQEKAIKESAVQNVIGRYADYIRMLVERPELSKLLDFNEAMRPAEGGNALKLSPEEQATSAYLLLGYGIFEEVYSLYKKKWMDEETWQQWSVFQADDQAAPLQAHPQGDQRDLRQGVSGLCHEAHRRRHLRAAREAQANRQGEPPRDELHS